MSELKRYVYENIPCKTAGCDHTIDVVLSPVKTLVTRDQSVYEINEVNAKSGIEFEDYLVIQCPNNHKQRVFIKYFKDGGKKIV